MPDIDNLTAIAHAYVPRLLRTEDWISVRPYVMELTDSHLLGWASSREMLRNDMLALTWTAHVATTVLGRALTHDGVLAPDVIEYAVNTSPWTTRVRGTRRSVLIRLGRELNPNWPFGETAVRYGYISPDVPYSDDEVRQLVGWASSHSTDYQRNSSKILLALGLGAGLRIGEMATLRAKDVARNPVGVTVTASGFRGASPREIQVRAEWEDTVVAAVDDACADALVLFPRREKATTQSVAAIMTRIGKPQRVELDTRRLRTTWIVGLMHENVPEGVIAQAAGLASLQHYSKWVTPGDVKAEQARLMLRGGSRTTYGGLPLLDSGRS